MTRKDLISSPEYWTTNAQIDLFNCASKFMEEHGFNRKQLAEYLGVSKSYITQLLNGDFDHRLSKFTELAISFGYIPKIEFMEMSAYLDQDAAEQIKWNDRIYNMQNVTKNVTLVLNNDYSSEEYKIEEAA